MNDTQANLFKGKLYSCLQLQKNNTGCWLGRGMDRQVDMR